jgi:cell division transport system permease protein
VGIGVYGTRHAQAFLGSLGKLLRNPFSTFMTTLVIGLALSVPLALKIFVTNAGIATGGFANAIDLSVYFKQDVALDTVKQLARNAGERPEVAEVKIVSSADALQEFREYSGFGTALEALQENPLPHVLHVRPAPFGSSPSQLEALKRYFSAWPEVDMVQMDSEWVIRFNAILDLMRRVLAIAASILGLSVLAIIGNTIRLEILNRRAEIEVTKLVGGTNAFVRRPFLYTGMFYGLIGALLAWLVVTVAVDVLAGPVRQLAQLYGSRYVLHGPTGDDIETLLGTGVILGWLGAWISSARHLRKIEPRA